MFYGVNIPFFIHSAIDRHLGCFYFLALMHNAAVNTCVPVLVRMCVFTFLSIYVGVELLSPVATLCLTVGVCQTIVQSGCTSPSLLNTLLSFTLKGKKISLIFLLYKDDLY